MSPFRLFVYTCLTFEIRSYPHILKQRHDLEPHDHKLDWANPTWSTVPEAYNPIPGYALVQAKWYHWNKIRIFSLRWNWWYAQRVECKIICPFLMLLLGSLINECAAKQPKQVRRADYRRQSSSVEHTKLWTWRGRMNTWKLSICQYSDAVESSQKRRNFWNIIE